MLKIIKNENEFKVVDMNSNWSLDLDCDFEAKVGKNYHLEKGKTSMLKFKQENGITRYITDTKVKDGLLLEYKETTNQVTRSGGSKVQKWNWQDYVTEEEKVIIEEYNKLMEICIKRHDDEINNPIYKKQMELNRLKALIEQQEKELEELKKEGK